MARGGMGSRHARPSASAGEGRHHGASIRVKPKTYARIVEVLKAHGFLFVRAAGSHRQFHRPGHVLIVTVPYHGRGTLIKVGVVKSIARQSGIPELEF